MPQHFETNSTQTPTSTLNTDEDLWDDGSFQDGLLFDLRL